jgi:hypothetical protein
MTNSESGESSNNAGESVHPQDIPKPETGLAPARQTLIVKSPLDETKSDTKSQKGTPVWEIAAVLIALGLLVVNIFQLRANKRAANAAKSAADTAHDTLIASNRPWMNAEMHVIGPLAFNDAGANIPVSYKLINVGHSPAMKVWADVELYLPLNPQRDTEVERIRLCGETIKQSINMGQTVFPGADTTGEVTTAVNPEAIQKAGTYNKSSVNASIIVCIAYQSTIEKDVWHTTGIVYDLWKVDERGVRFAITPGKDVPLASLRFGYSFFRGTIAN